ncbi:MAG: hypothetical protein O7E54_05335 [Planctomycetota bacterium]|nr:hypothetical protein [Planctomycetota bacterium]
MDLFLGERLGRRVHIRYNKARTMPVRAETLRDGTWRIRLHAMFRDAPPEVWDALAAWLRAGRRARRACTLLDTWIDARLAELPNKPRRRITLRPQGTHHDLDELASNLFADEFVLDFPDRESRPRLTWGRAANRRVRRTLTFGSFTPADRLVRIHPILDQPAVPGWFVRYILFHELLHAALPTLNHGGKFNERERAFGDYARAKRWEQTHIAEIIASARSGKPLKGRPDRQRRFF